MCPDATGDIAGIGPPMALVTAVISLGSVTVLPFSSIAISLKGGNSGAAIRDGIVTCGFIIKSLVVLETSVAGSRGTRLPIKTDELCCGSSIPSDGLTVENGGVPNTVTLPGMAAGFAFKCCCNFVDCFECLIFLCFFFSAGNTSFDLKAGALVISLVVDVTTVLVTFVAGKANILGLSMDG